MHEGHRERLYKKFIDDKQKFSEIDYLELMLCYSIARKDVKPIAAKLLEKFGSINDIIKTPPKALMSVTGVGEKTAAFFKMMGDLLNVVDNDKHPYYRGPMSVIGFVNYFKEYFKGLNVEQLVVAMLDSSGNIIGKMIYTNYERDHVNLNIREIVKDACSLDPYAVIMAHNHFSGNVNPSEPDDITTRRIMYMLEMNGVKLYDHIIFCKDKYFSYFSSNRFEWLWQLDDEEEENF